MSGARHSSARDEFFLKLDALVQKGCLRWQRESQGESFDPRKPLRVDYFLREILGGSSRVFWAAARAARANPDKEGIKTEWSFDVFCNNLSRWVKKSELDIFRQYFSLVYWPAEAAWRGGRFMDREYSNKLNGMIALSDFTDILLTDQELYRFWSKSIRPLYVSNNYQDAIGLSRALCDKSRAVIASLRNDLGIRAGLNLVDVVARTEMMMLNCGEPRAGEIYRGFWDLEFHDGLENGDFSSMFVRGKLMQLWGGLRNIFYRAENGQWLGTQSDHLFWSVHRWLGYQDAASDDNPVWDAIDCAGDCCSFIEGLMAREGLSGDVLYWEEGGYPFPFERMEPLLQFIEAPEALILPEWAKLDASEDADPLLKSSVELALARCSLQGQKVDAASVAKWLVAARSTLDGTANHLAWSDFYFWCAKYMSVRGNSGAEVLALRNVSRLQTAAGNNEKAAAVREEARERLRHPLAPTAGPPSTDEEDLLTFLEGDPPSVASGG